ncbi:hypothetical protein [Paraburkholderia caribensis]|nr:hypothetical protein [Paraburkholderia caribensis]
MKVDSQKYSAWLDQRQHDGADEQPLSKGHDSGDKRTIHRAGQGKNSGQSKSFQSPQQGQSRMSGSISRESASDLARTDVESVAQSEATTEEVAAQVVIASDVADAAGELNDALYAIADDIENNTDTTDDVIKLAQAFDQLAKAASSDGTSIEQQEKIARLIQAMKDSKPGDTLASVQKKADIDPSRISHHSGADVEAKYGKLPSTIGRAIIFDWARFHNSKLLQGTALARLQRPALAGLSQLGPYFRPGALMATRFGAAASYFTKGFTSILSGLSKLSNGQDPTKDFVAGSTALLQGLNELTLGNAFDMGNHLARLHQLKAAARPGTAAPSVGSPPASKPVEPAVATPGTSAEYQDFGSNDPLYQKVDDEQKAMGDKIDTEVSEEQQALRKRAMDAISASSPDVRQLTLQDQAHAIAPEYIALQKIGDEVKKRSLEIAKDTHENIVKIDEKAQETLDQLKALGFDSAEAARQSGNAQAMTLVAQLDHYADLKRSAYDVFNHAMQQSEETIKQSARALEELKALKGKGPSALKEWADKYGKYFSGKQDTFLKQTDSWPEWMKISKPLRMQMIPAATNTLLGVASFGLALDSYLNKQKSGTLTPQDKLDFAAAVMGLVSGISGFMPVVGPIVSLTLGLIGAICSGVSDQYDSRKAEGQEDDLKEQLRAEWNAAHPNQQIAEPFIPE